jgi:3'(2'), 5'-bisphosphate nucleotidase
MPSRKDHLLPRDVDDLGEVGDRESHVYLMAALAAARPTDAILSEEGKDDPRRLTSDRVWILDPLDGTREYGELGRTDWAVHVALWERGPFVGSSEMPEGAQKGGGLVSGAVARPARGMTLSTAEPPQLAPRDHQRPLRITVSRTRPPRFVNALAAELGAGLVPMGSAGARLLR